MFSGFRWRILSICWFLAQLKLNALFDCVCYLMFLIYLPHEAGLSRSTF